MSAQGPKREAPKRVALSGNDSRSLSLKAEYADAPVSMRLQLSWGEGVTVQQLCGALVGLTAEVLRMAKDKELPGV